jgi:hypothetical protein
MAWVRASIPVAAVIAGGRPAVISGSRITQSGTSMGSTIPTFDSSSGTRTMAFCVTSEPVPAVVGTIRVGSPRRAIFALARSCRNDTSLVSITETIFATSITLPPPMPTIIRQPAPFAASNIRFTWSASGSGGVSRITSTRTPEASRIAIGRSMRPASHTPRSVMTRTLSAPRSATIPPMAPMLPGPATTCRTFRREYVA